MTNIPPSIAVFKFKARVGTRVSDIGHLSISLALREVVGLVKNFYGVICAPMVKHTGRQGHMGYTAITSHGNPL